LPLRALRSPAKEEYYRLAFHRVVDAISGSYIDFELPHAVPEKAVFAETAFRDSINAAKYSNSCLPVRKTHQPVPEREATICETIMPNHEHGSF